ncbi:acyl--CoA ligase [Actinospica durhamensis]|uniref:Acyl--CoA ligase n=1 Tax=Actinospica durhamensis TaxID=1508375 RepID=A0A941IN95_9ACTN|nr:class I adenylate-forming enzyme family protein [Actinospica durhamensis]MBR7831777.1 acyl--CoA ligase [Actinospica durhamensis]
MAEVFTARERLSTGHPVVSLLTSAARLRPHGWAVRDGLREWTYPELVAHVAQQAEVLADAGVFAGAYVSVTAVHDLRYLKAYFALLSLGANVLPQDPLAGEVECAREDERCAVDFHLDPSSGLLQALRAQPDRGGAPAVCEAERAVDGRPMRLRGHLLLPTSGTGGLPKRAVHRPSRLVANAAAHGASVGLTSADTTLLLLCPAFGYCHTSQILAHVLATGRLVFGPRPAMPSDVLRVMHEAEVTNTTVVPHQLNRTMVNLLGRARSLRQISLGGSPFGAQAMADVRARLPGVEVMQTWGMTECGPRLTTWRPARDPDADGCVGRPIAGVEVFAAPLGQSPDLTRRACAAEERPGAQDQELWVRTPYAMLGYLGDAASDVLSEGDLIRTGDVGSVDADGSVYVQGRIKNLIDVGGKKVAAEELELFLRELPGVAQVKVIGRPSDLRGEEPVAEIVLADGAIVDATEILQAVHAQFAAHKHLREVRFVTSIESTPNGKVLRR